MDIFINGLLQLDSAEPQFLGEPRLSPAEEVRNGPSLPSPKDPELLRRIAWEIGERRTGDVHRPTVNHLGLAMVTPGHGFAHWNILQEWTDRTAAEKGHAWHQCRLILRVYDVSYIEFNGLNAHCMRDFPVPALSGHMIFTLNSPGTWQLAEVGFLLRNGEFLPAARSHVVAFARNCASPRHDSSGLLVSPRGRIEAIGSVHEQEQILRERRRSRLRQPLRIAAFTFASEVLGHPGASAVFTAELALGLRHHGHEVHVFAPASTRFPEDREIAGVQYHALEVDTDGNPLERAEAFRQAALERFYDFPTFDLIHLHEWMAGLPPRLGHQPLVLSLSSLESTRCNGAPLEEISRTIAEAEREVADTADCILTPGWLREQAVTELTVDAARVHSFPMEGRLPNEWESPLDFGQVKKDIGVGPLDRMLLFVGPLEHAAGVDLVLEALPALLNRASNVRLVYAGAGPMHGALEARAHQLGVAGAVRLLGHVDGTQVRLLVRSAEVLILPSRYRLPFDDAVVDLARRAGRPVITTHGGPAHLIRHEENGLVTYDNPGSMVWAVDRILGDPAHAERMGQNGRRSEDGAVAWSEVARHYLELCAAHFPELNEARWE